MEQVQVSPVARLAAERMIADMGIANVRRAKAELFEMYVRWAMRELGITA